MPDNLILDFPVLRQGGGNFVEKVSYEVEADRLAGKIKVTHRIKGQSFIRQLIEVGDAKFSILLLYRDSSERQSHLCNDGDIVTNDETNEMVATQIIDMDFSYAPEVTPSIIILESKTITVDDSSGLTDFWEKGDHFDIPKYSRIALGPKLKFTSGDISKLMEVKCDEKLGYGEMKVSVNEIAGEGETPVSLLCGKGVYDELCKVTPAEPCNAVESMRMAIITQALCAVYAYMQNLPKDDEVGGVLLAHLEMLEDKTGENWKNEEFNPSLAATKMQPYAIKELYSAVNYD